MNITHYILVSDSNVSVKEASFFKEQGGLEKDWGKNWEPIEAGSLYDARRVGIERRRFRFPHSHPTVGENEPMETAWPEARGQ